MPVQDPALHRACGPTRNLSQNHPELDRDRSQRSKQREQAHTDADARLRLSLRRHGDCGTR